MAISFYWVYILACQNDRYYTGYTTDLQKRYTAHLNGKASKFTRSFKPLKLAQAWKITGSRSFAMAVERYIKQLPRSQKTQIVASPHLLITWLKEHMAGGPWMVDSLAQID